MGIQNNQDFQQIKTLNSRGMEYYAQWKMGSHLLFSFDSTTVGTH